MKFSDRFTDAWPPSLPCPYGPYRALVTEVHDGDTLTVLVDFGCEELREIAIRLYGVQSEELEDPDPVKRKAAEEARDYLRARLNTFTQVRITTLLTTKNEAARTFARYVASVEALNESGLVWDAATDMVKAGHARYCNRNMKILDGPPPPIRRWFVDPLRPRSR